MVLPGIGIDSFQEAQMTCYKTAINMTKKQINQRDYVFGTSVKFDRLCVMQKFVKIAVIIFCGRINRGSADCGLLIVDRIV